MRHLLAFVVSRPGLFDEQHPQLGAVLALYSASVFGALRLRSLVAFAIRVEAGRQEKFGAVRITRGALSPQVSQGCGRSNSAMGRMSVKGPQVRTGIRRQASTSFVAWRVDAGRQMTHRPASFAGSYLSGDNGMSTPPLMNLVGPADDGMMSKSKISVGSHSVAQAFGMSTTPEMWP